MPVTPKTVTTYAQHWCLNIIVNGNINISNNNNNNNRYQYTLGHCGCTCWVVLKWWMNGAQYSLVVAFIASYSIQVMHVCSQSRTQTPLKEKGDLVNILQHFWGGGAGLWITEMLVVQSDWLIWQLSLFTSTCTKNKFVSFRLLTEICTIRDQEVVLD